MTMRKTSLHIEIRTGEFNLIEDNNARYQRRPVQYIARDERGLIRASKTYNNATPQNSIDFLKHIMPQVLIQINSIHTDSGTAFYGPFTKYLAERRMQHKRKPPYVPHIM